MKILVTPTSLSPDGSSDAIKKLSSFCPNLIYNNTGKPLGEDGLISLLKDCDGYLAGLDIVTERVLKSCPELRAISRYGAGYDRVDLDAAKSLGILVSNTPGANAEAVAELTLGHILSLARNLNYLDTQTKNGSWVRSAGIELAGKTIGIIGLGAIGKIVARCALGFNMDVLAYDPYIQSDYCSEHHILPVSLDEIFCSADIITLHLPLNKDTFHLINSGSISRLKKGVIIVNASRGGIIDEEAAFTALKNGTIGGLGLDAFEKEPPENSPLFTLSNVIATPHTGAHTKEATQAMAQMAVDNLINMLSYGNCKYLL